MLGPILNSQHTDYFDNNIVIRYIVRIHLNGYSKTILYKPSLGRYKWETLNHIEKLLIA